MQVSLKNKRILVTGAGRGKPFPFTLISDQKCNIVFLPGIGNELCKALYADGAYVIAVSRSPGPLNELKAECPGIETISVDLSVWDDTRKALENVANIDGLVNNAGIAIIKAFEELSQTDFDE
jgi:L-xylulose reductase